MHTSLLSRYTVNFAFILLAISWNTKVLGKESSLKFFYQLNCSPCKRQLSQLHCLSKEELSNLELIGVGKAKLKLKQLANKIPGASFRQLSYRQSSELWQVSATPTWVISEHGERRFSQEVVPCQSIKQTLVKLAR